MYKRLFAAVLLAAISCSLFACKAQETNASSLVSSSNTVSSSVSSSSAASSGTVSSGVSSSASKPTTSSSTSSKAATKSATKSAAKTETQKEFTFKDGVYSRVYGNRAFFIVTKDPSTLDDKAMNNLAKSTAGEYYKNDYYCTVCFVKPDKKDGTFDITRTKNDNRVASVFAMHHPKIQKITINLKENPLQEYIDKQFKKAVVKK